MPGSQDVSASRHQCLRTGDVGRKNTGFVLDWLHVAGDDDVMTAMLDAAEAQARIAATGMLCAVWNPMDARFLEMQRHGH